MIGLDPAHWGCLGLPKVSERVKALLQTNTSSSLNNNHDCISNKKEDYNSDNSQTKFPGQQEKVQSELKTKKSFWRENQKGLF